MKKESSNPFGSDSDSDDNVEVEVKQKPVSLQAPPPKPPRLSLNPFGSDFEDDDEGNEVVPEQGNLLTGIVIWFCYKRGNRAY